MNQSYIKHFPYENIRSEQKASIEFAIDAFSNGKKYVILELGTGCGKSAIGITMGRYIESNYHDDEYMNGCVVLTTQKILQEQYISDFAHPHGSLCSIKSASNYQCSYNKQSSCKDSLTLLKSEDAGTKFWKQCTFDCSYKNAKKAFIASSERIANYSYFLTETMHAGKIKPCDLLVLDEAHNIENELSKLISISVSEKFSKDVLKLSFPEKVTEKQVIAWIKDIYEPALKLRLVQMHESIKKLNIKEKLSEFRTITENIEMLEKHSNKIEKFLQLWNDDLWVMTVIDPQTQKAMRKIEFRPVSIAPYADEMLFKYGKHVLMMSATIVDKSVFCRTVGLDENDVAFLSIDSPFNVKNRPIYYAPAGSMSKDEIDKTLPKLVEIVKLLLEQHKKEKGIIHCHTYKIAKYINDHIKSKRFIIHDSLNRDAALQKHLSSTKPTILLSPSMAEGVDLKDDLSRFQVICKVPFPYLGDKLVRKRMANDSDWYNFETAKMIIQSVGRSIRNENDHAVTYIIDNGWSIFYNKNKHLFPASFKNALKS